MKSDIYMKQNDDYKKIHQFLFTTDEKKTH